jgi:hypothetical protein
MKKILIAIAVLIGTLVNAHSQENVYGTEKEPFQTAISPANDLPSNNTLRSLAEVMETEAEEATTPPVEPGWGQAPLHGGLYSLLAMILAYSLYLLHRNRMITRILKTMVNKFKLECLAFSLIAIGATAQTTNKDFTIKAFHLDMRCEVMTMDALKNFADHMASIGVNALIMEYEATFPYTQHATLSNKYAYTKDEIKSFVQYCTAKKIDVIPLQNCFGHSEFILRHSRYAEIREDRKEVSQVCPMKEELAKEIFTEIFTEVAALHPSPYFHIGCDETYLLGSCKLCAEKVEKEGKSKLFVDYVKTMCDIAKSLGKTPLLWADIILKYPEAVTELPKDIIFIDWNYGWERDYFGKIDNLLHAGMKLWGAPALRSSPDNLYLTQWRKHFDNIADYVPECRDAGYKGIVMTSWSTGGTYGFLYDAGWEVIDMYPIRYVYPLSGFNILIDAYGESISGSEHLDVHRFIIKYGQEHFGLSATESEVIYTMLNMPQNIVKAGKDSEGKDIKELIAGIESIKKEMASLKPKKNGKEIEHFLLMLDLRLQYLIFKEIENRFQSKTYTAEAAPELYKEIVRLKRLAKENDKRFLKLNSGFLFDDELIEINRVRNEKLNNLFSVLKVQSSYNNK